MINPVNYPLAAVNFFVGVNGLVQLGRIAKFVPPTDPSYRFSHPKPVAVDTDIPVLASPDARKAVDPTL